MGDTSISHTILMGEKRGRLPLGRMKLWEDDVKTNLGCSIRFVCADRPDCVSNSCYEFI
jgi:hypothetical protein